MQLKLQTLSDIHFTKSNNTNSPQERSSCCLPPPDGCSQLLLSAGEMTPLRGGVTALAVAAPLIAAIAAGVRC